MSETNQNVNVDAQKNQANRETFEREWARLSMPGHPERNHLDSTPVCGRFVTVRDGDGGWAEYELDAAVRALRDFHDAEGRTSAG